MTTITNTIANEIQSFIRYYGGNYSLWYVGITANPQNRFREHNLNTNDIKKYWDCGSEDNARNIERYFIDHGGCQGGTGGGYNPRYVYVYKTNSHTIE